MPLDRAELTDCMDGLLSALASKDRSAGRLAPDVRYTENGQLLPVGEGAWATADALGPYRHDFVDEASGNIATITTLTEGRTRSIFVARIRADEDGIAEIEAMVARPDPMTPGGPFEKGPDKLDEAGLFDPRWSAVIPEGERLSREELRRVANLYFAGLERNDGKGDYPFADDCVRIENGFRTTGEPAPETGKKDTPYAPDFRTMSAKEQFQTGFFAFVDRIRHRRFPVIDAERGLVFSLAFFDHSGTVRSYRLTDGREMMGNLDRPFTWQIAEAFKVERGLLTRIEAVMTACPYGMGPNWPMLAGDIA